MSDATGIQPTPVIAARPGRTSATTWIFRLTSWVAVASLLAWNVWTLWLDWSPRDPAFIDGLIASGRNDEARGELLKVVRSSPADGESRMKLARILAILQDREGCAEQLHRIPPWSPSKVDALFMEGQVDKLLERARAAESAWLALLADDPLHPVSRRYYHGAARDLVGLYILERRLAEVRRVIWKVYEVADPAERPGVLLQRVRAELELIAHPEAAAKLRLHVAADPSDWDALRALAFEEHALGDEAAADRDMKTCLGARPDDLATWRDWFRILAERGDTATIRSSIDRLPAGADRDAALWLARGNIRQIDGDIPGASAAFRKATELEPYDAEAAYKLGQAEQLLGHADEARIHRDRSRQLYRSLGDLRGSYEAILQATQRPVPDAPAYEAAVRRMSDICRELGWPRESDAWLRVLSGG